MNDAALIQIVDAALAEAARKAGPWLACRLGCTECCMGPFAITPSDAERLRQRPRGAGCARPDARRERAASRRAYGAGSSMTVPVIPARVRPKKVPPTRSHARARPRPRASTSTQRGDRCRTLGLRFASQGKMWACASSVFRRVRRTDRGLRRGDLWHPAPPEGDTIVGWILWHCGLALSNAAEKNAIVDPWRSMAQRGLEPQVFFRLITTQFPYRNSCGKRRGRFPLTSDFIVVVVIEEASTKLASC